MLHFLVQGNLELNHKTTPLSDSSFEPHAEGFRFLGDSGDSWFVFDFCLHHFLPMHCKKEYHFL